MASGGLGALTVDLLLETLQWQSGLSKADYQAQKFADAIEGKFNKMADIAGEAMKGIVAGVVAGFSAGKLLGFINETQSAADRLDELAQKTNLSVGVLAELGVYAKQSGADIEAAAGAMVKFNKNIVEGLDATTKQGKAFDSLRVALTENGELRKAEDIARDTAAALAELEDGTIKTGLAIALYGKQGADMIPILNAQRNATDEQKESIAALAAEMTRLAPVAGALEEQQSVMATNTQTMAALLGQQFIPYLSTMLGQWNKLTEAGGGLSTVVKFLVDAFKGLVIVLDATITGVGIMLQSAMTIGKVMEALYRRDFSAAADAAKESWTELGGTLTNFGKRVDALLNPMEQEVRVLKEQKKATDEMVRAVQDLTEKKIKLAKAPKIDMGEFKMLPVKEIEAEVVKLNENIEREILRTNKDILSEQKRQWEQYLDWLEQQYGGLFADIDAMGRNAFDSFFSDVDGGWKGMMRSMAADFKKLLMNVIYQQVAKPLILNLMGNMGGGMGQYAQMLGGGGGGFGMGTSGMGNFSSMFSDTNGAWVADPTTGLMTWTEGAGMWSTGGMSGAAGWGAGWSGVAGVAGGLAGGAVADWYGAGERGQEAATNYGAMGAMIGMQVYGPIGALVGWAIGTIAGIATDPDPDAMRAASFGSLSGAEGVTKWKGRSKFGEFGFSAGEWLSDEQMDESMNSFIATVTSLDNALAEFLTDDQVARITHNLDSVRQEYELGMEHENVTGLGEILRDRIVIITKEINEALSTFVEGFAGPTEEIIALVGAYMAAYAGGDFEEAVQAIKDAPSTMMEAYQAQLAALQDLPFTTSAEDMLALTSGMEAFQTATIQMILAIDQAAAAMHNMFMSTADNIRMSIMSEEERYTFLQDRASSLFDQLLTETDPARIQTLAEQINADINAAWGMLDEDQRAALAQEYIDRINMVDETVADKMEGLRDIVIEDAENLFIQMRDRFTELFAQGATTADTNADAANTMLDAANRIANTTLTVRSDGSIVTETGDV